MKWSKFPSKPADPSKVLPLGPVQVFETKLLKRQRRKVDRKVGR